jgi:RNA polymerase sigma-B factor
MWQEKGGAEARSGNRRPSSELEGLAARYAQTRDARLREYLIEAHQPLVEGMASRFCRRGAPLEDLIQVAAIGLILALDRFDPSRGVKFTTYAVSTIVGEIKHYFRDCTWSVKVPRQLQEIAANLARVDEMLSRKLGRAPTVRELAAQFGASEDEVVEAIELDRAYLPYSLDAEVGSDGDVNDRLQDLLGGPDERLQAIVEYAGLHGALAELDSRKEWILRRRYFDEWTQVEVSRELGVSQMHVSRLEREALDELRWRLAPDQARPQGAARETKRRAGPRLTDRRTIAA